MYSVYKMINVNNKNDQVILYGLHDLIQDKLREHPYKGDYYGTGYFDFNKEEEALDKAVEIAGESSISIVLVDGDDL